MFTPHPVGPPPPPPIPPPGEYPIARRRAVVQVVEGILHAGQAAGERQQEVHHLVEVPDKHAELVKLVGLAHGLDQGLHLITQCAVGLHILQQALLRLPQHLQLAAEALDELLLWVQRAGLSHGPTDPGTPCTCLRLPACGPISSLLRWPSGQHQKNLQAINAGGAVEKRETLLYCFKV